jgi:AbrB family looped-hinge helix DNA binding protein
MAEPTLSEKAEECLFGIVTVGERGQVVIPAEARKELHIQPGDKLLIWKHPSGEALMLFRMDAMREFMRIMLEKLERAEQVSGTEPEE